MSIDRDDFTCEVKVDVSSQSQIPSGFQLDGGYFQHKVQYVIDCDPKSWGLSSIQLEVPVQVIYGDIELIDLDETKNPDGDSEKFSIKINLLKCEISAPDSIPRNGFIPTSLSLTLSNFTNTDNFDYECDATGVLDFYSYPRE